MQLFIFLYKEISDLERDIKDVVKTVPEYVGHIRLKKKKKKDSNASLKPPCDRRQKPLLTESSI